MKIAIIRWILFLFIGYPINLFFMIFVYPLVYLWYLCMVYPKYPIRKKIYKNHYIVSENSEDYPVFDSLRHLFLNTDTHSMLTQYTIANPKTFKFFVVEDQDEFLLFTRTPVFEQRVNLKEVSGDCVISFCFAASLFNNYKDPLLGHFIKRLAKTYLVFLGTRSYDEKNKGHVSNRCNNFGVNWCPDGWGQIGQPFFGPQFYTSSCLFALAAQHSFFWRCVFWIHWIFLGGWYWALAPAIYPEDRFWYIRDMTMKALWVHYECFGPKWWIILPMKLTERATFVRNPLFCAMLGDSEPMKYLPDIVDRFWSQRKNANVEAGESSYFSNIKNTLSFIVKRKKELG